VVVREPLPLLQNGQDWKFSLYGVAPSTAAISGDAGASQQVWRKLVNLYQAWSWLVEGFAAPPSLGNAGATQEIALLPVCLYQGWQFALPLCFIVDVGLDIIFVSVDEASSISLCSIVGKEGGSVQFLGSREDLLYITFRAYRHLLDVFLSQSPPTYNVRFTRHDVTWWEGEATLLSFSDPVLEAGAQTGLVSITIALRGTQKATVGPAIGMLGPMLEQQLLGDLIMKEVGWSFMITTSGEFSQ